MEVVSSDLFLKLAVPKALTPLTKRTARVQTAFEELMVCRIILLHLLCQLLAFYARDEGRESKELS
jgi:hypothetical protein